MTAYYNEFDPFAAAWLRELIKDGLIAPGEVDERSITDIEPSDLKGFTQCHFFAGIGGWSHALRLAGWADSRPVWTGSPPCQPFSTAGKRKGKEDERHLWPAFFDLIRECQPPTVFGEQVASAIRDGWFDDLQTDMEREGYATGMVVLPACSIGAPHKRDRLWFVADSNNQGTHGHGQSEQEHGAEGRQEPPGLCTESGTDGSVGDTECNGSHGSEVGRSTSEGEAESGVLQREGSDTDSTLGNPEHNGSHGTKVGRGVTEASDDNPQGENIPSQSTGTGRPSESGDLRHWEDSRPIYCRDGKYRPIPHEPALFPLANGIPNRVGTLRGAGNAIVPQVAAEVIGAFMEVQDEY